MQTHKVLNQATALAGFNLFLEDRVLTSLLMDAPVLWAADRLVSYGAFAGSARAQEKARLANENPPILHTHDRFGNRIDQVEFHPAYHWLMEAAIDHSLHCLPWTEKQDGAHVVRAALMYLAFQLEAGHCCPISMTNAVVPSLRMQPELTKRWIELISTSHYDPSNRPADQKLGITFGMGMTEKQGGSDVRANTTSATPLSGEGGPGQPYLITGHKWFCSAPMSDAFLILAKAERGLSCFLVPRIMPDGSKNTIQIQRLKDKLGNRSNASGELEFENAFGWLIGGEGRGVPTIIEMVNNTRLDCSIGAAALMRQASLQAIHHCRGRSTFGKLLVEHPLMLNVLADLALESEAAIRLAMRVAKSFDAEAKSPAEAQFKRIASAIAKYWICKRAPMVVAEALECLGGNGYVEESPMPRLFRESPLLGIWEGSGNVICLDVLRAIKKEPETLSAVIAELVSAKGYNRALDRYIDDLLTEIAKATKPSATKASSAKISSAKRLDISELTARSFVERLALGLQAVLLVQGAPTYVSHAFIASRISRHSGYAFGTLPSGVNLKAIVDRAYGSLSKLAAPEVLVPPQTN